MTQDLIAAIDIGGINVPDSLLARDAARVIRAAEGDLLSQHFGLRVPRIGPQR